MKLYLDVIREAVYFFPLIAFLFTVPYMIFNYHKYGSVLGFRTLVVYSFILYLLCVYFLVILPLPSKEEVAKMTGPRMQLIPFRFLYDIWKEADFSPEKPASILTFVYNPALFHGQTPGKHITRIRITTENGEAPRWYQYFLRSGSLLFLWFFLPFVSAQLLTWLTDAGVMRAVGSFLFLLLYLLSLGAFLLVSCIRASLQKPLFYEKISGTRVANTIRPRKE